MNLSLDARQRAMLQEMGVHVWSPRPAPAPRPDPGAALARSAQPVQPATQAATPALGPSAAPPPLPLPAPARARLPVPAASPSAPMPAPAASAAGAPLAWTLQAPQPAYPQAAAQDTADAAAPRWLLVVEGPPGAHPLDAEAGLLLENMLRALRLQHSAQVFFCLLTPQDATAAPTAPGTAPCTPALAEAVAAVQPAVLLLLGRAAARAVLGRSEPLGQLRAQKHTAAGVPAVVTYDVPYLLRNPATKAGAWDDLCRARALALAPAHGGAPVNA